MPDSRTFKVHYRLASIQGAMIQDDVAPSFESMIRHTLDGPHGQDYEQRLKQIEDGAEYQLLLNNYETQPPGVFAEIYHVEGRRPLRFMRKQTGAGSKTASIISRAVPGDEEALGQYGFLLAHQNHIATIETPSLRTGVFQSYFNKLFIESGQITDGMSVKFVPRIQIGTGVTWTNRGVSRIEVSPAARLIGDAPSTLQAPESGRRRKLPKVAADKGAHGDRILELFRFLGSSEAEIESIQSALSADLGLEAKVQIIVRKNARATEAVLDTADLSTAIEGLMQQNSVSVVSPDGRTKDSLTTLWDVIEIAEVGGEIPLANVLQALKAVMLKWAARGLIDLGA